VNNPVCNDLGYLQICRTPFRAWDGGWPADGNAASNPANAAKLAAADALGALADDAGITLIQLAIASATRHPAVTSAIIGQRTMEHLDSYLAADGIELPSDLLDRIDQIVLPGVTINVADNMWNIGTPALNEAFRRR
jgi:aryl-alcohol dehydrogenase-like predicted oxidoreductase